MHVSRTIPNSGTGSGRRRIIDNIVDKNSLRGSDADDVFVVTDIDRKVELYQFDHEHDLIDVRHLGATALQNGQALKDNAHALVLFEGTDERIKIRNVDYNHITPGLFIFAKSIL